MFALAALVLLASSTVVHPEDLLVPGTMVCTCTPAPVSSVAAVAPAGPAVETESALPLGRGTWGVAAGATALALFGGSIAAHVRSTDVTLPGGASPWSTASTAMAIGGAAMAGFSAAFFVLRF